MKHFFTFFLPAIIFISCGEDSKVIFTEPQPDNSRDLHEIPKRFRGTYLSLLDSSFLTITSNEMIRSYDFWMEGKLSEMDSNYVLVGDSLLVNKNERDTMPVTLSDSLVRFHFFMADTFFSMGNAPKWLHLRKMKGYLFLNNWCGDSCWTVQKMALKRGNLSIGSMKLPEDIEKLDAITETNEDTAAVIRNYQPKRKEFRKFVRQSGFSEEEQFVKLLR